MADQKVPTTVPFRLGTILVTNTIKLAGVAIALQSGFTDQRPFTLALAAFMMAGAQASETAILRFIDRFFGGEKK
jgi:hypothetical protein